MINFRGAVMLLALTLAGSAQAADLSGHAAVNECIFAEDSSLPSLHVDQIGARVVDYHAVASDALRSERVIGSRSPAFLWAREAKFQCGKAIGYLNGGYLDEQSVQKCDCAYGRLIQYR